MYQIVRINNPEIILDKTKARINLKSLAAMLYFAARCCHNSYDFSNIHNQLDVSELECHYTDMNIIGNYEIVDKTVIFGTSLFAKSDTGNPFEIKYMFMTNDKSFYFYNDTAHEEIELYIVRYY